MTLTKILFLICLYCLKCTKFDQLILGKIIKTVATRCQILMHQIRLDCGWNSGPDFTVGAYSAPPNPLPVFKRSTFMGREEKGSKGGRKGRGRGPEGKGEEEAKGRE